MRAFIDYCTKEGIQQHRTAAYTPEQNGVVQMRNQTIIVTPHVSKPHDYVNHMFMRP
jgi:hypothetical protein